MPQHKVLGIRLLLSLIIDIYSFIYFFDLLPCTASWGQWTEWTPECYLETLCDPMRMQSRNRRCLLRDKRPDEPIESSTVNLPNNIVTPCIAGSTVSAADVEIRACSCATRSRTPRPRIPFHVVRPTKASSTHFRFSNTSIATFDQLCSQCRSGEVCVARLEEIVPVCRWAPNPEDPSGCGGFCRAHTESCIPLGSNSFKYNYLFHDCVAVVFLYSNC